MADNQQAEAHALPISSGARTVDQMATYLAELKQSAVALKLEIDPVGRGYFVAAEEEMAHALLISYWQTRLALHELIDEMLGQQVFVDPQPASIAADSVEAARTAEMDQRFLIAFSAALLLVDSARFLRSLAKGRPVIRRKLNQPVPAFGVEGGTYDSVQKSMLSARRGWRLIQSRQYFDSHRKRLRQSAECGPDSHRMVRVFEIVDEMISNLGVSWARFFYAKFCTTCDRILRGLGRRIYTRTVYNLQQFGSEIVADVYVKRGHRPELDSKVKSNLLQQIQPGDVLVVRKQFALTNYFLPGYWPHAALYLGRLDQLEELDVIKDPQASCRLEKMKKIDGPIVLEAMKDGVNLRSVESAFASDSIVVLRPALDRADLSAALARAITHEGKSYDFDFDFSRSDRLVCTEVVYRAYDGLGPIQFSLKQRAGRPTLSGEDLLKMARLRDGFRPIMAFEADSTEPILDYAVDELIDKHNEKSTQAEAKG